MSNNEIADQVPALVWTAEARGIVTYANIACRKYLGNPFAPNTTIHWDQFVLEHDVKKVLDAWRKALTAGESAKVNARLKRFDGRYRWHKLRIQPIFDDARTVCGACGIAMDIDDFVQAGEAYEVGERRLRFALDAARVGAWEWDMGSRTARISAQLAQIYGLERHEAEVPLQWLFDRIPESYRAWFARELTGRLHQCVPFELDFPIELEDGRRLWLRTRGETDCGAGTAIERVFGVTYDITEQHDAQTERERSEQRYRALVEASSELTWIADAAGHTKQLGNWQSFAPEEGLSEGCGWLELVHPDDQECARDNWSAIVKSEMPGSMTFRLRRRDGSWRTMSARAAPLRDDDGTLREWFCMATDVTDERAAAAALEERNLRLQVAMRAAKMTIGYVALDSWTVCWDSVEAAPRGLAGPTGLPYDAALQRVHSDDRAAVDAAMRRVALTGEFDKPLEFRIMMRGHEHWLQSQAVLQRDADGKPWRVIASAVDITQRKTLELALRETDRRKDEFLAMLAHELRNPLAPMRNAIALLRREKEAGMKSCELVGMLSRQVDHMAQLVDDLLEVSRITHGRIVLRREPVLLGTAVYGALETVSSMAASRSQHLTVTLPPAPVWLHADPLRLSQILVNVLNNACKYTDPGGSVCVTALADERFATVTIEDNGSGISSDLLPHIFDLFAQGERTLDRAHGGLGIGLSLVKKLVELHGGGIDIASPGPGRGATVSIRLPLSHAPEAPTSSHDEPSAHRSSHAERASLHVLIVDDNKDAADSLALLCESEGYHVDVAYAAQEALAKAQAEPVDAALLDIGLPDTDGYELARLIRQRGETRPVLIAVTGYGQADDHLRVQAAGFDHHLVKPVDIEYLMSLLAELTPAAASPHAE
ncbi:PAS domain-containing hybrid sensor histidine kinase/response regulator [Paraburkholderia phenoliruptrix]|uniref:PAS domain-containing hybrid sensor histidine kinase/response regulator n=1 Tax=Paraburkholderia phenoliruptrix TaxID=252970 RepID=UPI001C4E73A1|nr:PAS domain-containing protein [Paraburkholderia phenoliruptrix]MBW0445747.1 PAS domain-containing protein [Paraburkholderia phenoliruptrix]MBW9096512.1 PAS domain-containing protein [Paraburkholderia phenoliruptrix]